MPIEIKVVYDDSVAIRTDVYKSCGEFKNGRIPMHKDQRIGTFSLLIVEKIENLICYNRKLTVDQLSAIPKQLAEQYRLTRK